MFEFFAGIDWAAVLKIVGIDIMLGGDNAILIALACAGLAPQLQNKAIALGTAGAVLARVVLLALAGLLFGVPFIKTVAGLYLVWIGYKLLVDNTGDEHVVQKTTLWGAVSTIVIADLMMSLDNVLAVTAAAQSAGEHALGYAIAGILLSIPIIVYGSKLVISLMEKFPIIIWTGAMLLGWVGLEMVASDASLTPYFGNLHEYGYFMAAVGAATVGIAALFNKMVK